MLNYLLLYYILYYYSSKEWWKLANSMKNVAPKIGNNITIDCFYDHFTHLFSDNNVSNVIPLSMPYFTNPFLDSPFELNELILNKKLILKIINHLVLIEFPMNFIKMLQSNVSKS